MKTLKNERGAVIVFVAVFLLLLFGFIGLASDVGWMTYVRNQGQARVDSAALAGASGLPSGQAEVEARVNTFSTQNPFTTQSSANITPNTDPVDVVDPLLYDQNTNSLTPTDWNTANAVRVTNAIPTTLLFKGVMSALGREPVTDTTINVNAVAYLGCPGYAQAELPLALCDDAIGYPNDCNLQKTYQVPDPTDNTAWTGFTETANASNCRDFVRNPATIPPLGSEITLTNGQVTSCLQEVEDQFCHCFDPSEPQYCGPPSLTSRNCCPLVPVVQCNPPTGPLNQMREIVGFARMCIHGVEDTGNPKTITISLECDGGPAGTTGGECFGTDAQNPILVR